MPADACVPSLVETFSEISNRRDRRGVRHPLSVVLALVIVGLLGRVNDFAALLRRWAARHWRILGKPFGFTRRRPPHATTMNRVLARFSLSEFQSAFAQRHAFRYEPKPTNSAGTRSAASN
jgi:hypothetical protein